MKPRLRWPRGRYNCRRITGLRITLAWRCDMISWRPEFKWNYSEPFIWWLGFHIRLERTFHFSDR